jgi:Flp pilus assembly protein TadD
MRPAPSRDAEDRIERFQKLVEQFPSSELPLFSLGQAYLEADRFEEAVATFDRILTNKPDYMMAHVHRAQALFQLDRLEEAREACRAAIALAIAQDHVGPREDCEDLLAEIEAELD